MFTKRQPKYFRLKCLLCLLFIISFIFTTLFFVNEYFNFVPILKISNKIIIHVDPPRTTTCRPYIASDTRPFFERDYPQVNLPRQISNSSYQNVLRQLHSLRLIVVSCARNIQSSVDKYRNHIEPIVDLFHSSSRILIFESDSRDRTMKKLLKWSRAQVYTYGKLSKTYSERPERLGYCRNVLLAKAYNFTPDYILVADADIFSTSVSSFLSNFQYDTNDWSVMTASSNISYYDIWALRTLSDSVMNYDVWHRMWSLETPSNNYCSESLVDQIIGIHRKPLPIEHDLIEVRSAFGGAGLYKANSTYGCQYNGTGFSCEHVPFHSCIRNKNQGRIFINPKFQIA